MLKRTALLACVALLALPSACKKKKKDGEGGGGDAPKSGMMEAPPAMNGMAMDPGMKIDGMKADGMKADGDKNHARCLALYTKALKSIVAPLGEVGVPTSIGQLSKLYQLDKKNTLSRCMSLSDAHLACAEQAAAPLDSKFACKLPKYLSLYAPSKLEEKFKPKLDKLDDKEKKRLQKYLTGKWVLDYKEWISKDKMKVDAKGNADYSMDRKGKVTKRKYVFSFEKKLQMKRKWKNTTQTLYFLEATPKRFHMVDNLSYNLRPITDKKKFSIHTSTGILHYDAAKKKCFVLSLTVAHVWNATCKWERDKKEKTDHFTATIKRGRMTQTLDYYFVKGHLVHKSMFKFKWIKK